MADIDRMCEQAGIKIVIPENSRITDNEEVIVIKSEFEADLGLNRKRKFPEYLLNEMAAELLATGYDVKRRLAVLRLIRKMRLALESKTKIDFSDPDTVLHPVQNCNPNELVRKSIYSSLIELF